MKTNKKSTSNQRRLIEKRVKNWLPLKSDLMPPKGWLNAMRGALGMTTRQLANRLGVQHSAVIQFEKSEARGKASISTLANVAKAMHCKLVYAIVPDEGFESLESILDYRAQLAARTMVARVGHSMRLEQQGLSQEQLADQTRQLANSLKMRQDATLWSDSEAILGKKGKKTE